MYNQALKLMRMIKLIIKVKPCFSNPKKGGNGLNSRDGEEVVECTLRLLC
jgi:hypothetical protein